MTCRISVFHSKDSSKRKSFSSEPYIYVNSQISLNFIVHFKKLHQVIEINTGRKHSVYLKNNLQTAPVHHCLEVMVNSLPDLIWVS